jgi:glycosyltransferase involved in cell wall biosynthesis
MWGSMQFFFILFSFIFKIPLIVQPHGMLLPEALRGKSILSYILKLINVYFFYKFLLSKCIFIAVTTEEKKFILKYFKKSKVFIIKNSFHIPKINVKKINKKFVYFGRYNKHKNLKEFIQAYIFANPDKEWTFEIYGIEPSHLSYVPHPLLIRIFQKAKQWHVLLLRRYCIVLLICSIPQRQKSSISKIELYSIPHSPFANNRKKAIGVSNYCQSILSRS